jgi:hypothetical protein
MTGSTLAVILIPAVVAVCLVVWQRGQQGMSRR